MKARPDDAILSKLWQLLSRRERQRVGILMVLVLIGIAIEALGLGMVVPAILLITTEDLGVKYPQVQPALDYLGNPAQSSLVLGGLTALVVMYLIKSAYLSFLVYFQTGFVFNVRIRLSESLFATYLAQPWTFHLQRNSAKLVRSVLAETQLLADGALMPFISLTAEVMLLFCVVMLLLFVEPIGVLGTTAFLGLAGAIFYTAVRRRVNQWGERRRHHEALRILHLQQGMHGAKDAKILARESELLARYRIHNLESCKMLRHQAVLGAMPRLWLEFLGVLGLALLVSSMILQGRDLSTVLPTLGLFAAVSFRIIPSFNKVLGALQSLRFNHAVVVGLYEELTLPTPKDADPSSARVLCFNDRIHLEGVSFRYPGAEGYAISEISMDIRRGESVGLVGQSGSGKSTLSDLIIGVLEPSAGAIQVDGQDIWTGMRSWQSHIGYVPQVIYLTDDTLRRNIAFGLPDHKIDAEAVDQAVARSQLKELVDSLPQGLDTEVGERGVRLSGGQRQRIGIARALYRDPEVLVLDEATSALDSATEGEVMAAIDALHGSKTIIIVAHRLSTIAGCDRVFRLEQGRLVDEGPSQRMIASLEAAPPACVARG